MSAKSLIREEVDKYLQHSNEIAIAHELREVERGVCEHCKTPNPGQPKRCRMCGAKLRR